jgi:hypothetical protein
VNSGDHWLGRSGSDTRKSGTSQVVAPPVSVKGRWVGPHGQVSNVPIAYWWYEPSKHISLPSTDAWLYPHYFISWLRRETGYESMDRSADVLRIVSGAPFLRCSNPAQLCWWLRERLLYVDHVRYVRSRAIRRSSVKSMWHVGRVFLCRVYIDSNHRDSQIWVPLVRGSHYEDNLMAWIKA